MPTVARCVDNSLPASKLAPADRAAFLKDAYGKAEVSKKTFEPLAIAHIGGSFKTNKTKVGEFTLPASTWLIKLVCVLRSNGGRRPGHAPAAGASRRRHQHRVRRRLRHHPRHRDLSGQGSRADRIHGEGRHRHRGHDRRRARLRLQRRRRFSRLRRHHRSG